MSDRPRNLPPGPMALWDWMERRGLTQRQLARETGIHWSNINHVLTNRRTPGLANALKIERATGIPVEAWQPTKVGKAGKRKRAARPQPQYMQGDNGHAR